MATIGSATPGSPRFPLETFVTAIFRLIGVLAIAWGSIELMLGIISSVTLFWMFAAVESDTALFSASPSMVAGLAKGLAFIAWGVVLAVVSKRLTQYVTKDM